MPIEYAAPAPLTGNLPVELRAGLDRLVESVGIEDGRLRVGVLGQPALVAELERYAPCAEADTIVVALGVAPQSLEAAIVASAPARALLLTDGRLAPLLRPLRASGYTCGTDLPLTTWRSLGYERATTWGGQGVGMLIWALCQRLLERLRRPDLADRCRIALLRSVSTAPRTADLATVVVRDYRRVR